MGVDSTSHHVEAEELRSRHQAMGGWDMHKGASLAGAGWLSNDIKVCLFRENLGDEILPRFKGMF